MGWKTAVIVASGGFTVVATVPYVVQILRQKAKPQPVSWGIWAMILAIGGVSALLAHQLPAAVYNLACGAECALVAGLACRIPAEKRDSPILVRWWCNRPDRKLRLDWICGVGAGIGLIFLVLIRDPILAVVAAMMTDAIAFIPTVANGWNNPRDEVPTAYCLYAVGAGLALAVANLTVFVAVAYPAYQGVADAGVAIMIWARRAKVTPRYLPRHVIAKHQA